MQDEKYDERDRAYNIWHRRGSISRYVGYADAQLMAMSDVDDMPFVEWDGKTKLPLALIETAIDVGQKEKANAGFLVGIAKHWKYENRAVVLPCFVVFYKRNPIRKNPASSKWYDIDAFRVQRIYPPPVMEKKFDPKGYADWLLALRKRQVDALLGTNTQQRLGRNRDP